MLHKHRTQIGGFTIPIFYSRAHSRFLIFIQRFNRQPVAKLAKARDLADAHRRDDGRVAKRLTRMDIGEMHLHKWFARRGDCITQSIAVVRVSARIHHAAVIALKQHAVNSADKLSLAVGLEKIKNNSSLLCKRPQLIVDILQRLTPRRRTARAALSYSNSAR